MGAEPAQHESPTINVNTDLQRRLSSFGNVSCDHRAPVYLQIHCSIYLAEIVPRMPLYFGLLGCP